MHKIKTKKSALRGLVSEVMFGSGMQRTSYEQPVSDEPPVKQSERSSIEDIRSPVDPPTEDPDYVPSNRHELSAAAAKMANALDDSIVAKYYEELKRLTKRALDGDLTDEKTKTEDEPVPIVPGSSTMNADDDATKTEAAVRKQVAKVIAEVGGLSFSGWDYTDDDDEEDEDDFMSDKEPKKRKKSTTVTDVSGASLDQIARELGFAAPIGAKAFIDRTLEKFKHLFVLRQEDPIEFDKFLLMGVNEYIEYLQSSGELTPEDVELMKRNPAIVVELDGFREYVHKFVKRAMRDAKKKGV